VKAVTASDEARIETVGDTVETEADEWRLAFDIVQGNVVGVPDDLQPAFGCGVDQVAGDLGLAIDRHRTASQRPGVDTDHPIAPGEAKAILRQSFGILASAKAKLIEQIRCRAFQHAGADARQHIIG